MTIALTTPRRYVTLEEFRAMPEGRPLFELENGELIPMPSPTPRHQDINGLLFAQLHAFVREHKTGRVFNCPNVQLPDDKALIPDIAFLSTENLGLLDKVSGWIEGSPDLVVEITSANASRDRISKFRTYFENSVAWYWIVDPDTLGCEEYHRTPDGYVRTAGALAGEAFTPRAIANFAVDLAKLLGETVAPPAE